MSLAGSDCAWEVSKQCKEVWHTTRHRQYTMPPSVFQICLDGACRYLSNRGLEASGISFPNRMWVSWGVLARLSCNAAGIFRCCICIWRVSHYLSAIRPALPVPDLPVLTSWRSMNSGDIAQRSRLVINIKIGIFSAHNELDTCRQVFLFPPY